ncbi:PadR family transcriptional regulator [Schumannella sp. 10F1B-5-1]|uniref:PadR family transcriptional regulator n=1 Tax=Schumannella sp. 10F1B-5-1 TaxID=2590780 RepID=UPI0011313ED2|nr:PadR family transcriptional regulator [Schumannella sp. 10F1B-5-1]TPW70302.1 PadR family transcriptional regulator [Schumannella sp. 10F1B-5-1]
MHGHGHDGRRHHGESHQSRGRGPLDHGFGAGTGFGPGGPFGPGFAGPGFPGFPGGPGPFGRRSRRGKGDVRSAILSLLGEGPNNGYGLMKAIAEKTDGAWRASPGSVYPTLQQLVDEELIVARGEGRGTEYELSETGRAYLADNQEQIDAAWERTPRPTESMHELGESIGKLMGVIGQFHHGATEAQRKAAVEKLDEARRALYLILAE